MAERYSRDTVVVTTAEINELATNKALDPTVEYWVDRNRFAYAPDRETINYPGSGSGPTAIPFSTTVPLDGNKSMALSVVAGAVALTIGSKVVGGACRVQFRTDGTNVPSITGASEWASSFGYDNSQAGLLDVLDVWTDDGTNAYYAWSQPVVNTAVATPVAPSWSTAPVVTGATVGSPVTFTSGAVTGTPTPTLTFRTTLDGAAIGTANAAYTPVSGDVGKSIRIIQTATNTAGAVDSAASAAFVVVASGGLQAQTTDYISRITANGGTVTTGEQNAVDAFFVSANASGYLTGWAPRLSVPLGDTLAQKVPLLVGGGAALDVWSAGVSYSQSTGWTYASSTDYIDLGLNPITAGGSMGAYLRTAQASDTTLRTLMGCRNSASTQQFRITGNGNNLGAAAAGSVYSMWGDSAATPYSVTTGGMAVGLWHQWRTSSTFQALYKNGVQLNSSATAAVNAAPGQNVYVGSSNAGGAAAGGLTAGSSVGYAFLGGQLSTVNSLAFYNHMQTFMTALGRQV